MTPLWTRLQSELQRLCRDSGGAAFLEVAVVVPVLFTIGLGVIEFGNIIYTTHRLQNAVRDGARYAAGRPVNCCDAYVKTIVKNGTADLHIPGTVEPYVKDGNIDILAVERDNSGNQYRGGAKIYTVTVHAYIAYQGFGYLGYLQLTPPTLEASHEERLIGVR